MYQPRFLLSIFLSSLLAPFVTSGLFPMAYSQEISSKEYIVDTVDVQLVSKREGASLNAHNLGLKTKTGEVFSQDTFDKDLKYLSERFHRVEPEVDYSGKKVSIKLKLWPRRQLKEIVFEGNEKFEGKLLRKQLETKNNSFFDRAQFTQDFKKLRVFYLKKGYYQSHLSFKEESLDDSDEVRVVVKVEEGKPGFIDSIHILGEGVTPEDEEAILTSLFTKSYFFLTSWMTSSGLYQQEAVDQDILKVASHFQDQGYADVKVEAKIEELENKNNKIKLKFFITKGNQYHLKSLKIEGNSLYNTQELKNLLEVKNGGVYAPRKIYQSSENIRKHYGKKGYIDCYVAQEVTLDDQARLYEVTLKVHEGKAYRVGLIKVFGNERTKNSVILHESLLTPGEYFDVRKVEATEENLMAMEYFKSVNVYAVDGDSSFGPNFKDVHIDVEEKSTGKFGLFGSYSKQEKVVLGLTAVENNFDIKGFSHLSKEGLGALRGGGENLYARVSWGSHDRQNSLAWAKPHFLDTPWTIRLEGDYHYSKVSKDQENKIRSFSIFGIYNLNAFLRTQLFYKIKDSRTYLHLENTRLLPNRDEKHLNYMAQREALNAGINERVIKNELAADPKNSQKSSEELDIMARNEFEKRALERFVEPLRKEISEDGSRGDGVTSTLGFGLIYDSTNHPLKPSKGLYSQFTAEYSGLGGDHKFFKINYENTHYYDITEKLILKSRLDFHFLLPQRSDDFVPFSERFFLGGDFSIRGYRNAVLGPKYQSLSPGATPMTSSMSKGGLSSTLLSSELDYRFNQYVTPFVFLDVGDLNGKKWHFSPLKNFKASYGAGAQCHVLPGMPPIVLGWGMPIKPANKKDEVSHFFFTIGIHF